jgi:hypothetical protein
MKLQMASVIGLEQFYIEIGHRIRSLNLKFARSLTPPFAAATNLRQAQLHSRALARLPESDPFKDFGHNEWELTVYRRTGRLPSSFRA